MNAITFFDMLGIDPQDPSAVSRAAALWPKDIVSQTPGFNVADDSTPIVNFLLEALQFTNVRPGVDGAAQIGNGQGQFTLAADVNVIVDAVSQQQHTFYFRQLPDIGLSLYTTKANAPAHCYFAKDNRGWELIVEALPAIVTLKAGMMEPSDPNVATDGSSTEYNEDELDNLTTVLRRDPDGTQFFTNVRIHIRPGGDVIFEPNIPLNQGACRFLGLPVNALYDFLLIPAPQNREYYEWARNDLSGFISDPPVTGAIGFRSVDFDLSKPPFSDLQNHLKDTSAHPGQIELVCEDVVIPVSFLGVPIPSHGTLGFRRKIVDRSSLSNAFSLKDSPVVIQLCPTPSKSSDATKPDSMWSLSIDQILIQSGEPPVIEFQAAFIWQNATGDTIGGSIGIADDWTLQVGVVAGDKSPAKFTIVDTVVSIHAAKFGLSFGRLMKGIDEGECWQILADLSIQGKPTGSSEDSIFKMRSLTGKPLSLILRDIGYSFGHASISGLSFPEGVQLIVCNVFRLIIEEMGWVEEPTGTPYFSFSGGFGIGYGGGDVVPSSNPPYGTPDDGHPHQTNNDGLAIEVRRLRFRTNDDDTQPFWKVDGISLFLKYNSLVIAGFGFLSDTEANGWKIREMGFGVQVQANVMGTTWMLAAQFFKGHRQQISDPSVAFDYFLAALAVGYLPAGSVGLYSVRLLMANNMTPATDPSSPDGQGMVLYKWHKDHDTAIDMPRDRNLGDWKAEDNSLAFGMGCGFSFNGGGNVMHLNIFVFLSQSEEERGLLVVGELFLLKNVKPIAFVAIEYNLDTNKFGILAGLNLKLSDFADKTSVPDWMNNLVSITGNIYFGNQPWTVALGQLADQRTWPSIQVKFSKHVVVNLDIVFIVGICFEWIDEGPKGFGVVFSLTAGAGWGIGQVNFFGSFGFLIGNWKTGSDASGVEAWIQLGLKIYVFYILHLGADVTAKLTYLGKHPWYTSLSITLRIDTPWWMPDVSFSYDKTWQESLPYDVDLLARALSTASALGVAAAKETVLLTPPLSDGQTDASQLYSFNQFAGLAGVPLGDVHLRTDIPILPTDSTIAINFTNPASNDMGVAADTFGQAGDAGVQKVQDLTVRYGLKSIAVRRSPRFGSGAGTWTDLVAPSDTALDLSGNVHLAPSLAFRWDADSRSDGSLSPKRLLLNSATPYSFTSGGAINDEQAMRWDPGFPCCNRGDTIKRYFPRPHVLSFQGAAPGARLPLRQQFSSEGIWWQWNTAPLPLATLGINAQTATTVVAMLHPAGPGVLGGADLSDPAVEASCAISWSGAPAAAYFEGYAGLKLVARQQAIMTAPGSATLRLTATQALPITRLLLRVDSAAVIPPYSLQIELVDYIGASEDALYRGRISRCGSIGASGGKLAFLPNHDYEVTVTTEVKVSTKSQGERSSNLSEVTYFATKGLPGLNSVVNTGDEIEPYIESLYPPAQAALLYRAEPVAVAFNEGMSSILPVDRVNAPTDPPEKTQAMELALNIDRVGSTSGLARLTVPSGDWIDAHRAMPPPPRLFPRAIVTGTDVRAGVRKAPSLDPRGIRFAAVQSASSQCTVDPLRSSQVLLHEPVGADNLAGPWERASTYRATVRQKDGPYTQRTSFDILDSGAFVSQADGAAAPAGAWSVNASKALVAPAAGSGRQYASFGELTWNHLRVSARFDPHGAAAGIAVGVAGQSPVPQAILATIEPDGAGFSLVLRARSASGETELGRAPITATGPVTLTVYAFDDAVRAQIGDTVVEGQRGAIREGRASLVAAGPAEFFGVSVDGLDLYRFDFHTSSYLSFQDHIRSWDGNLVEMAEGVAGATSASLSALLAADSAAVAVAMKPGGDPQGRQALFTKWMTALAIPLRQQPDRLGLSRWTSSTGTQALLMESPEPISFNRDVSLSLIQHVQQVWPPIGDPALQAALSHLSFAHNVVTVSIKFAIFHAGDLIVLIIRHAKGGPTFEIYNAPLKTLLVTVPTGTLRETVTPPKGARPELDQLRGFPDHVVALLRNGKLLAAVQSPVGPAVVDKPIDLVVFDSGPETAALLMPATTGGALSPLGPGKYTLTLTINRKRWRDSASSDPESAYTQQQSIDLSW